MSNQPNRLGRGLESLIPTDIDDLLHTGTPEELKTSSASVVEISVDKIAPNPLQPRKHFDSGNLDELASSIKTHGVVQPLVVIKAGDGYQLIAGERRLRAAKLAKLKTVPAIVRSHEAQEQLEVALIENIQRSELNSLELAAAYTKLNDQFNLSPEEIGKRVGRATTTVANVMRLLKLTPEVKQALIDGQINDGLARTLLAFSDPKTQVQVLEIVIKRGLNVRQVEEMARKLKHEKEIDESKVRLMSEAEETYTRRMSTIFGTKVSVQKTSRGGKLVFEYDSEAKFEKLVKQILR